MLANKTLTVYFHGSYITFAVLTVLYMLYIVTHLSTTPSLWSQYYDHLHFIDEEIREKWIEVTFLKSKRQW